MPTKIEWTEESWNPVTGCSKISTGCRNCYAERMAHRLAGRYGYPPAPDEFKVTLHPDRLDAPNHWKKPRKVFVCSMGDLFHEDVPADFITDVFEIMTLAKQHTFQVLTKRPERMISVLFGEEGGWYLGDGDFIPNIWLGVTAENQETADRRIPWLLQTTGFVKFVSVEPMLGPVNLSKETMSFCPICGTSFFDPTQWADCPNCGATSMAIRGGRKLIWHLDWVICGGETGPGARSMKWHWAESLYQQCLESDVPFFFKKPGDAFEDNPELLPKSVRQWPKVVTDAS